MQSQQSMDTLACLVGTSEAVACNDLAWRTCAP